MLTEAKRAGDVLKTKVCPRCGQALFADMTVCYGCLYDFSRSHGAGQDMGSVGVACLREILPSIDEPDLDDPCEQASRPQASEGKTERAPTPDPAEGATGLMDPLADLEDEGLDEAVTVVFADESLEEEEVGAWLRICTNEVKVCVPVPEEGLVLGRSPSCDVVFHNPAVSRRHARVSVEKDGIRFCNLGAKNPPLFRGAPVVSQALVPWQQPISICGAILIPCQSKEDEG